MACPACHLFPETCLVCGAVVTRLARAVGPLAPEHAGTIVDELQRLVVDAERVTADIEAARRDGEEAGRLAAIRAEVERALEDLADDVESEARESRGYMRIALQDMRRHRSGKPGAGYDLGRTIGCWTNWERARRDVAAFLAATRRWLQETA